MPWFPILFGVGIIIAISGGAQIPADGDTWPDSTPVFLVGVGIALAGLGGWRWQRHVEVRDIRSGKRTLAVDPVLVLQTLVQPVQKLADDASGLDHDGICVRVDQILDDHITPFVDARQTLIDRLGMAAAAEILVEVAFGERMLNRAWSAASDGHRPEALASIPDARDALVEAARKAGAQTSVQPA